MSQLAPPWGEGEERCPQGILIPDSFLREHPLWATPPLQEPPDHSTPWLGWPTHIFHPRSFYSRFVGTWRSHGGTCLGL